jgi:phosphoglycerate dehydrogenase-like enzyme
MPKIVIPDDWPPVLAGSSASQILHEIGEVKHFGTLPNSEDRLIDRVRDADIVITIRSTSRFTEELFQSCPGVRLVSLWGTGTDNVDLIAAQRYGVTITNTPGVSATSIAEHALALMLAVARRIPGQNRAVRSGSWPRGTSMELYGKTLGIIGLGAIGRRFAQLGQAIGMRVIAWTMHPNPELGFKLVEFEQLLRTSDVISLHLRLSPETRGMIGAHEFGLMKSTAILVNTARGAIVDEEALVEALSMERIYGAGLDVFAHEPLPAGHSLSKLPNVVLTPHSAGITQEALESGLLLAVRNVISFLAGTTENAVI